MKKIDFYEAVLKRRSVYSIGSDSSIADSEIEDIVKYAIKNAPSAFNSQSQRVVLAFGEHHIKIWQMLKEIMRSTVPSDSLKRTEEKIDSFMAGHGTILYYEDQKTVAELQKQFPLYADKFPIWSQQASGMLQYILWTALSAHGLGANLQHYNPIIDSKLSEYFDIPADWKLNAQMPFGKLISPAGEKQFMDVDQRIKVFR